VRVFLDTNVLVSAFATRGLCADVLRTVLSEHERMTGEVVLAEFDRVLSAKLRLARGHVGEILGLLKEQAVVPAPTALLSLDLRDEDHRWVIASAMAV
jgi:predicted nucleic acid-binding protein